MGALQCGGGRWCSGCRALRHTGHVMFVAFHRRFPKLLPLSADAGFPCPRQPMEREVPDFFEESPPCWPRGLPPLPRRRGPVLGPSCGVVLSPATPHMAVSSAVHKIEATSGSPAIGPLNRLVSLRAVQNWPHVPKNLTQFQKNDAPSSGCEDGYAPSLLWVF